MNMHWEDRTFVLPEIPGGFTWEPEITTSEDNTFKADGNTLSMVGRSVAILVANKKK